MTRLTASATPSLTTRVDSLQSCPSSFLAEGHMYDFIPDTHGQRELLEALLARLGYRRSPAGWRRPDARRRIVFLGDYVDRGPDSPGVVRIVRDMVDAGAALAITGNHEVNMIRFHADKLGAAEPMRTHSPKNIAQHAETLAAYRGRGAELSSDLHWMAHLPFWLDLDDIRAVHAAWDDGAVDRLAETAEGGRLGVDGHLRYGKDTEVGQDIELLTCGPEVDLPPPHAFTDQGGHRRTRSRIAWWRADAETWRDIAVSVPDLSEIPDEPVPGDIAAMQYPGDAAPVLFGHYWKSWGDGPGAPEAANAFCLDYSAALDGPLVCYRHDPGEPIDVGRLVVQHR